MRSNPSQHAVFMKRNGAVFIFVGALSAFLVYTLHDWYHTTFLQSIGLSSAIGDALGGFFIISFAYSCQFLTSFTIFHDVYYGLLRSNRQLHQVQKGMEVELGELNYLASTDRLTGAWNRRYLEEMVKTEIERLAQYHQPLSMILADIDHFKAVNDRFGHAVGDQVLITVAQALRTSLRGSDSLARWGGEEFVVLCPHTSLATAQVVAERLRSRIEATSFDGVGQVTISLGIAECLIGESATHWFERADAALYRAKQNGRNRSDFASEHNDLLSGGGPLETGLVRLSWHPSYECGYAEIDRQHQLLFLGANQLLDAVFSGSSREDIRLLISHLLEEVKIHFHDEETIIAATSFPNFYAHCQMHKNLLIKAQHLAQNFESETLESGPLFQFLLGDVITKHMLGADREFFPYLKKQQ